MDELDGARAILKAVNRDPTFGTNPAMQSELEQVSEGTYRSTTVPHARLLIKLTTLYSSGASTFKGPNPRK